MPFPFPMPMIGKQVVSTSLKVQDVFATSLQTGNGSSQTITTGFAVDLAWVKARSTTGSNNLTDTATGSGKRLFTDLTNAQAGSGGSTNFTLTGYNPGVISSGVDLVAWSFRKAAKFFDVVTYTGDGTYLTYRAISHNLGITPGLVIIKRTDSASNWSAYHGPANKWLRLNTNDSNTASGNIASLTSTTFGVTDVGGYDSTNISGATYVAYLFAHDPDTTNGIIQCGSVTTDSSGNGSYTHGWSAGAQYCVLKGSSTTGDWEIYDDTRSPSWTTDLRLCADTSNPEDTVTRISGTGTTLSFSGLSASQTYIGWFIRKGPM